MATTLLGYAQTIDYPNRTEGTADITPTARQAFTPIALFRNRFDFSTNTTLHVHFFVPWSAGKKIFLDAQERQVHKHYVMHAKSSLWGEEAWHIFEPWPASAQIDKLGIESRLFKGESNIYFELVRVWMNRIVSAEDDIRCSAEMGTRHSIDQNIIRNL